MWDYLDGVVRWLGLVAVLTPLITLGLTASTDARLKRNERFLAQALQGARKPGQQRVLADLHQRAVGAVVARRTVTRWELSWWPGVCMVWLLLPGALGWTYAVWVIPGHVKAEEVLTDPGEIAFVALWFAFFSGLVFVNDLRVRVHVAHMATDYVEGLTPIWQGPGRWHPKEVPSCHPDAARPTGWRMAGWWALGSFTALLVGVAGVGVGVLVARFQYPEDIFLGAPMALWAFLGVPAFLSSVLIHASTVKMRTDRIRSDPGWGAVGSVPENSVAEISIPEDVPATGLSAIASLWRSLVG